jgi:diguanylate cyclase (GGDEF)-like protein
MIISAGAGRDSPARAQMPATRHWALWSIHRQGLAFLLIVDALAITLSVAAWQHPHLSGADAGRLGLLFGLSAVYAEATDRVERLRIYLHTDRGVMANQNSIVCFAGLLLLPLTGALLLAALVYSHLLVRCHRHRTAQPYRQVFVVATVLLGTIAAGSVYHALDGRLDQVRAVDALVIGLTLLIYTATSFAVLIAGMCLVARPPSMRLLLPNPHEAAYEVSTLILGVLFGVVVLRAPWLSPLVFVLAAVLHRSSLVRQLQTAATTDDKTGLLNAGAWRELAAQQLARCVRANSAVALLLIDLDHFKSVNDTYGHLAGDAVLALVGQALKQELRGHDAVGRYGGEEFAVLLADVDATSAADIADRVRGRIAGIRPGDGIRVTASIGLATRRASGTLNELVANADAALYRAKAAGRDRVYANR